MAQFRLHGRTATIYYNMNAGSTITVMQFVNPVKRRQGEWTTTGWQRVLLRNNGLEP